MAGRLERFAHNLDWNLLRTFVVLVEEGSITAAANRLLLQQPAVASVIVGAKTNEQLGDNIAATDIRLSETELKSLDEASKLPPEYPGWMFARQNMDRFPGGAIK